jgi:hypothetical protein
MDDNPRRRRPNTSIENAHPLGGDPCWLETEALIASAGRYVWPSDDLRPRVLDAALERASHRHTVHRLATMTVAATLCIVTGIAASIHLQASAESVAMPRGDELERLVNAEITTSGAGQDWVLADLFHRWRNEMASRLSIATPLESKITHPNR